MAQFARPESDTVTSVWTTTPLWSKIDEGATGDGTRVVSDTTPASTEAFVCKLSSVTDPAVSTGHIIRAKWRNELTGVSNIQMTAELRQGYVDEASQGTLIATLQVTITIEQVDQTDTHTLSGAEADSITNYGDLSIRCHAAKSGGGAQPQGGIDYVELETPDASAAQTKTTSLDGAVQETLTKTGSFDGAVRATMPVKTASFDGAVQETATTTASFDARIAKQFTLSASANIGAGGTDPTTAQLTAPSGKTTGDFDAGKISDDTNPVTVDITADDYTEIEFAIEAVTGVAEDSATYEFRIEGTSPLDTYTVIPEWTVSGAQTFTVTGSFDSAVQRQLTQTGSLDAAIRETLLQTLGIDGAAQVELTKTTNLEGVVLKTLLVSLGLDGAALDSFTATLSTDAALRDTFLRTLGLDAQLITILTETVGLDGAIAAALTVAAGLDGALRDTILATLGLDSDVVLAAFELYGSTHILPSSEPTTARLTPPGAKTTGDFHPGRISDDENPSDTVDVPADDYTEMEWSIEATTNAVHGKTYELRVTKNGVPLDTYTVAPRVTIIDVLSVVTGLDGAVLDQLTKIVALDAALLALGITTTADADAAVRATMPVLTASADGILQAAGLTRTTSLEAALQATGLTVTALFDAWVDDPAVLTVVVALDGAIQDQALSVQVSLAAAIQAQLTRTAALDAALRASITATSSLDSAVLDTLLATTSLDANITTAGVLTVIASLDAAIRDTLTATLGVDGAVRVADVLATSSLDSAVLAQLTATVDLGAAVKDTLTATLGADGAVQVSQLVQASLDAQLTAAGQTVTSDLDAALQLTAALLTAGFDASVVTFTDQGSTPLNSATIGWPGPSASGDWPTDSGTV